MEALKNIWLFYSNQEKEVQMKYFILLGLSFFVFIPVSQADIHLEPYGGAGVSGSFPEKKLFMSYMGGVRLGYSFSLLSAGLDLSLHHHRMDKVTKYEIGNKPNEQSKGLNQAMDNVFVQHSISGSSSFNPFSVGAFVKVDLPLFFDFYGAAFISPFGSKKDGSAMTGYGVKAGISFLSLPFVDLNAEARWAYYQGGSQVRKESLHLYSVMLSVSVPLSFEVDLFGGNNKKSKSDDDNDDNNDNDDSEEGQIPSFDNSDSLF